MNFSEISTDELLIHDYTINGITTPVRADIFGKLLRESGYPEQKTNFIIDGFTKGFSIHYEGPKDVAWFLNNLPLKCGTVADLWIKIIKEVKLGSFAGPFPVVPFDNFMQSPAGLVMKQNGDTCLVFHLSYPRNHKTHKFVNAFMPPTRV